MSKLQTVSQSLHDEDGILGYLLGCAPREEALRFYFGNGEQSAKVLANIAEQFLERPTSGLSLLEFASGSGRLTRHLVGNWEHVAACDIQPSAIDFLRNEIRVAAYLSCYDPRELKIDRQFDVVFALSFFTHIPEERFGPWLDRLSSLVAPGGLLVFTTHGRKSGANFIALGYTPDDSDFWFFSNPTPEYGQSVAMPSFVEAARQSHAPAMKQQHYAEAGWDAHQDLYVWRRI